MTSAHNMINKLSETDFESVIKNTPLISIDFVIKNDSGDVLLGRRLNNPAKNYWFVPGGRIRKDERIADAFIRLLSEELGRGNDFKASSFIGVYQHFYENNVFNSDCSTHYIVLAYELLWNIELNKLPRNQHASYEWVNIEKMLLRDDVHQYTKDYFLKGRN